MLIEILRQSVTALLRSYTRTLLTMTGITWGVVTVALLVAYGVSFRDITQRRERLRREREQAERLELALAAAGFGDWSWDAATNIVTLSDRAMALFGLSAGPTAAWRSLQDLLRPEDREAARRIVKEAVANRASYEVEYRIAGATAAEDRWLMIRARGQ